MQSERGRVLGKKFYPLVITITILGVIFSSFYLLKIANHCHISEKILSSKAFLLVKNQTLNKALSPKIHRSTKNIQAYGGPERTCYPLCKFTFITRYMGKLLSRT